ncbi:MAG: hypothetical protein QXP84_08105 [Candidatus Korarchaeum sp.]
MMKWCPLLSDLCMKSECGWFDEITQRCAVVSLSLMLSDVFTQTLSSVLAEKLGEGEEL